MDATAGPTVFTRSRVTAPMTASTAWTITIVKAIASRPERERANNTTTAATASARLRADAYIDVVGLDLSGPASETTVPETYEGADRRDSGANPKRGGHTTNSRGARHAPVGLGADLPHP